MKRILLIIIGLIPLPLGFLLNHCMMNSNSNLPTLLISIVMLVIWFFISMVSARFVSSKIETIILLNASAFLILLLNLFQEYIIGHYFMNYIGVSTQFFYLPFLSLGFTITSGISSLLASILYTTTLAYIVVFMCLILVTWLGRKVGERPRN